MRSERQERRIGRATRWAVWAHVLGLTAAFLPILCYGQAAGRQAGSAGKDQKAAGSDVVLDRVVAIVNGDLILDSDVDAEERFAAFQPFRDPEPLSRDKVIERLVDRTLIEQQMAMQPGPPIPDSEVNEQLAELKKEIPKCAAYHCETDAGWRKFVADQGFTIDELRDRWRSRMQLLRFIEQRFRMGVTISQSEIHNYYKSTLLPKFQAEHAQAPSEASISDRIEEILLQREVDKLLDDWLKALRAQGSVRILKPGEEAP